MWQSQVMDPGITGSLIVVFEPWDHLPSALAVSVGTDVCRELELPLITFLYNERKMCSQLGRRKSSKYPQKPASAAGKFDNGAAGH